MNGHEVVMTSGAAKILEKQGYQVKKIAKDNDKHQADEQAEMSDDEKFVNEVAVKPIAQWTKSEVKRYTELTGLDTSGAKTVADVKEIIKQHLQ